MVFSFRESFRLPSPERRWIEICGRLPLATARGRRASGVLLIRRSFRHLLRSALATPPHNGMGEEGLDLYNEVINIMRSGISGVSTSTYLHQAAHAGLPPGRSGSGRAIREAAERTKAAP